MLKGLKLLLLSQINTVNRIFIKELYEAGMNVIRINSAHLDIEGALKDN